MDISPFIGLLSDGKRHQLSVRILNNGNSGYWPLSIHLLEYYNLPVELQGGASVKSSTLFYMDSGAKITVSVDDSDADTIVFTTKAAHSFGTKRVMTLSDGSTVERAVLSTMTLTNENKFIGKL